MANITAQRRLHFDTLEQRDVPNAYFYEGEVVVYAPDNDAIVKLTQSGGPRAPKLNVYVNGTLELSETIKFVVGRGAEDIRIERIRLFGGAGNDRITNSTSVRMIAFGGAGHDVLSGGSSADELYGQDGEDTIFGNKGNDRLGAYWLNGVWHDDAGNDVIYGGDGNDTLAGGSGNDELNGNKHNDELWGDTGDDYMHGGAGNDLMFGGLHDDYMNGEAGADILLGNAGNDKLIGGANADALWGRDGSDDNGVFTWGDQDDDTLQGGLGNDYLNGQVANDYLFGDDNTDVLVGASGDDILSGGKGFDELYGDDGSDALLGGYRDDVDRLVGGPGGDRFLVSNDGRDATVDITSADARLHFVSGNKHWTETEILAVDVGLRWATWQTDNTRLLKLSTGAPLTFVRQQKLPAAAGLVVFADNDSTGRIRVANAAFALGHDLGGTIVHELGHNWDTAEENALVVPFRALSGWYEWDIHSAIPSGFDPALDLQGYPQPWVHFIDATFVSDYAHTNPREDFAESFAMLYHNTLPRSTWAVKYDFMQIFLNSLKDQAGPPAGGNS